MKYGKASSNQKQKKVYTFSTAQSLGNTINTRVNTYCIGK